MADKYNVNNMNNLFEKISSNFIISWNIESVLGKFIEDKSDPYYSRRGYHSPYSCLSGKPHWQQFPTNISFARNFYKNFTEECVEVANKLEKLKTELTGQTFLINEFVNHTINPARVNLIRIMPGFDVDVHFDRTRSLCINIGLKNSDSCITYISDIENETQFWENSISYTMNDKDAYILNTKKLHSVKSTVFADSNIIRYIITYNMVNT